MGLFTVIFIHTWATCLAAWVGSLSSSASHWLLASAQAVVVCISSVGHFYADVCKKMTSLKSAERESMDTGHY